MLTGDAAGDREAEAASSCRTRRNTDETIEDVRRRTAVDLVPVVKGAGNRPFFGERSSEEVLLGNPTVCVQGDRVTDLVFAVLR